MSWHHLRTDGGWEIRDENALLVATLIDTQHAREHDALSIVRGSRLEIVSANIEAHLARMRARVVELVALIQREAAALATSHDPGEIEMRVRHLVELRAEIGRRERQLGELRAIEPEGDGA